MFETIWNGITQLPLIIKFELVVLFLVIVGGILTKLSKKFGWYADEHKSRENGYSGRVAQNSREGRDGRYWDPLPRP